MRDFIGRTPYFQELTHLWKNSKTRAVAIYGRRRVGKTAFIQKFCENKNAYLFEAIEGEDTAAQIRHFLHQLSQRAQQPHLKDLQYKDWPPVFDLLTHLLNQEKEVILFLDELPWMAAGRLRLVSYIKYYWDKHWKNHPHFLLILCGSVASWMVKNVVRSKALYGRLSQTFLMEPLRPYEVAEFIGKKRGQKEVLEYLLCFGGIPKYLEEFDFNKSLELNIEKTCFQASGFFKDEAEKIFYNQFQEAQLYRQIANLLLKTPLSLQEISNALSLPSGGGLKLYLDNLISAGMIEKIPDIRKFQVGKTYTYYLTDEFVRFDHQFIQPNRTAIERGLGKNHFERFTQEKWNPFMGYAFERFCLKNRYTIAELLGFGSKLIACGGVKNLNLGGYQYDLVYLRRDDVISVCEMKYLSHPPSTSLIREMEEKIQKTPFPRGVTIEKILISNQEASSALKESGYFHQMITGEEIIHFK
ncbi:MAG: ATP-binding protein [Deltaproteobacteria bacterium]|nr:ATP-binding protein [Deltaproteobacteria bacterium]